MTTSRVHPLTEDKVPSTAEQAEDQLYVMTGGGQIMRITQDGEGVATSLARVAGTPTEIVRARSWLPADVPMGTLAHWPAYIYRYAVWWPQGAALDAKVHTFFQVPRSGTLPETWTEEHRTHSDGSTWCVATFDATQKDAESLLPAQIIADADLSTSVEFAQWRHSDDVAAIPMQRTSRQPSEALSLDLAPGDLYQTSIAALGDRRGKPVTQAEVEVALGLS